MGRLHRAITSKVRVVPSQQQLHNGTTYEQRRQQQKLKADGKFVNVRPLLPIATPRELHNCDSSNKKRSKLKFIDRPGRNTISKNDAGTAGPKCKESGNDVSFETSSLFWTKSLRTVINNSWSYKIPARPSASALKLALQRELDRVSAIAANPSAPGFPHYHRDDEIEVVHVEQQ